MYEESAEYRKIECPKCGWKTLLDHDGVYEWMVAHRIFRRNHAVEDEILYELFHCMTSRYSCPECGAKDLRFSVVKDDFSDLDARRCRGCRNVIPRERLEFHPDTQYCISCARKLENGEPLPIQAEYCPVCGKMMELVQVKEGRNVSFKWVCTTVPSCRYRK